MKDKRQIFAVTIFSSFFAAIVIAVAIPLVIGDGSGRYSGVKQAAALSAVEHARQYTSGIDGISHLGTIVFRVENVEIDNPSYASADTLCNNVFTSSADQEAPDRYLVTWSYRTVFDIKTETSIAHVCRAD